ncbi:hypothetical protein B0A55_02375 [Friedmanniomyces simplex]|uniref:Uncharacterized protein n=1 Tax=Friedmanniomyces simplex TaxID=329884 RepID=A0A4V5NI10_9PEZI|nr:hypothetical protein B0A55_02375 [Friedmanniomyces simplex]
MGINNFTAITNTAATTNTIMSITTMMGITATILIMGIKGTTDTTGITRHTDNPRATLATEGDGRIMTVENASRTEDVAATARITAPPQTPNCMNQSDAFSYASATESIFGCGLCTIYGEGVGLVYFPEPTTVSRDMCATTPSASLTHYGPGAVITAYAGTEYGRNVSAAPPGAETAILGRNTFVSGAAYISIATVWAEDRCSSTLGTPVSNAILAMPSESVLSLRYKQDHFQYFMSTDTQTGYPVSYADFNKPVPFSAWIGQARCEGQWDTWDCGVVYEDDFRPQLAIPPEIRQLNPEWQGCQMWYGGLYDPPVALQPQQSIAAPTIPVQLSEMGSTTAMPSQTASAPTSAPTALPDQHGGGEGGSQDGGSGPSTPTELPINGGSGPGSGNGWHTTFTANGQIWQASACGEQQACVDGTPVPSGGPAKTISGGVVASYGPNGLVVEGTSTLASLQQMTVDGGTSILAVPQQTTMDSDGIEGPSRPLDTTVNTAVEFSNGLVVAWSSTINIEGNGAVIASDTAAPNSDQNAATTGPQASSIAVDGQSGVSATAASLQSTATNPPSPTGSFQGSSDTTSSGSSDVAASSTRIDSPTSNDGAASAPPQLQLFAALVLTMIMMYVS